MKQNFYFFRHGQTNENRDGIRQDMGQDAYLLDAGLKQAEELAEFLSDKNLDVIYSSPYMRAVDTAKIVANRYNDLKIITDDDLREGVFGFWYNDDAESQKKVDDTFARVKGFLDGIMDMGTNIALSSHGGITRALCYVAGAEIGSIKNCECFHFSYEGGIWQLVKAFMPETKVENKSD